ncbi:MAG TPA: hypothetical protein ENH31_01685 [Nitrospirae bacterium]|nr:hypothetical protein [Nitrospirota bacterium]
MENSSQSFAMFSMIDAIVTAVKLATTTQKRGLISRKLLNSIIITRNIITSLKRFFRTAFRLSQGNGPDTDTSKDHPISIEMAIIVLSLNAIFFTSPLNILPKKMANNA